MSILVVDDSAVVRKVIREELEGGGYEVIEANNGLDALELVKQNVPDLITLDVRMDKMDGFETCVLLRAQFDTAHSKRQIHSHVPIVFITANDTVEGRDRGFEVGASEFITKPFAKGEVLAKVNKMLKPEAELQGITALVVEDSDVSRWVVLNALSGQGMEVLEARDGREGFEMAKANAHRLDLIVADYLMPEMNGDEFCRRVVNELKLPDIPIIMLSAMTDRSYILRMFQAGATDYLVKPFALEELLARINVHIQVRLLNRKLQEQVAMLEHASDLKDRFLSATSHDLRSPMTSILGFSSLLNRKEITDEQRTEYTRHIQSSGDHLLHLIDDLTEVSRNLILEDTLDLMPLDLRSLLEEVISPLTSVSNAKGVDLVMPIQPDFFLNILVDKTAFVRILNNLVSNAIKFTDKGGRVDILMSTEGPDKAVVTVKDTGMGMPPELAHEALELFSKNSRTGTAGEKGSGLGLSITKQLVHKVGGNISLKSKEGEGTEVKVLFNLASDEDETKRLQA